MNIYTKRVITLTNEERDILRQAAKIMGELYRETDDSNFDKAEDILTYAHCEGAFDVEVSE